MRKLIYSCMVVVATCMLFTSCDDEPKTFGGTYIFSNAELDIQITPISIDQATIDRYISNSKREFVPEYKAEFAQATITVDDINNKAVMEFYDITVNYNSFIQKNGKFTMTDPERPTSMPTVWTGTISDTEIKLTEDITEGMQDVFEGKARIDRFAIISTFIKQ